MARANWKVFLIANLKREPPLSEAQRLPAADTSPPMSLRPFHLAIPVHDITAARAFCGGLLGCPEGRSAATWVDFDLYGHQLVAHLAPSEAAGDATANPVDGHDVPVPHFGVVLAMDDWEALAAQLTAAGVRFGIEPHIRFKGEAGEQADSS
jgi:extradiol dioxygenase family protein